MEECPPLPAAAGVAVAALLLAAALPAAGYHDPPRDVPYCDSQDAITGGSSWDTARIQSIGYVTDLPTTIGVDEPVEKATGYSNVLPDVFKEKSNVQYVRDAHVVGTPLDLHYPGFENYHLGDDLPNGGNATTVVEDGVRHTQVGMERTFAGAHRVSMVFTGRILVWGEESFTCHNHDPDNPSDETHTAQKVALSGVATAITDVDDAEEDWGTGVDVTVKPGDESRP